MSSALESSSSSLLGCHQLSPRANIFLLLNLGCEMLFVIDQRLKAQQIAEEKAIQVIHDITAVLLDPKFVDSIIVGSTHASAQLLTVEHCKFMLKDIATCSLMRLDDASMEKLWNLMTVIYKWQLFVSKHQHHLLDITFRHLTSISQMHREAKRSMLIDVTKNTLLDFWNASTDQEQLAIYRTNISWLQCFNTKISVLIRLGFQTTDGTFFNDNNCSYLHEFVESIGENIYVKSAEILNKSHRPETKEAPQNNARFDVNQLAEIFRTQTSDACEDLKPIDAGNFQRDFEKNLKQCNVLFEDLDVNRSSHRGGGGGGSATSKTSGGSGLILDLQLFPDSTTTANDVDQFVQMKPTTTTYNNRSSDVPGSSRRGRNAASTGLTKDLLDFYSKIK